MDWKEHSTYWRTRTHKLHTLINGVFGRVMIDSELEDAAGLVPKLQAEAKDLLWKFNEQGLELDKTEETVVFYRELVNDLSKELEDLRAELLEADAWLEHDREELDETRQELEKTQYTLENAKLGMKDAQGASDYWWNAWSRVYGDLQDLRAENEDLLWKFNEQGMELDKAKESLAEALEAETFWTEKLGQKGWELHEAQVALAEVSETAEKLRREKEYTESLVKLLRFSNKEKSNIIRRLTVDEAHSEALREIEAQKYKELARKYTMTREQAGYWYSRCMRK
jgi:chromosome segregation ATPase